MKIFFYIGTYVYGVYGALKRPPSLVSVFINSKKKEPFLLIYFPENPSQPWGFKSVSHGMLLEMCT